MEKSFEVKESVNILKFAGDWAKLWPKRVCLDNLGQSIWKKVKKCSKNETEYKALTSTFTYFLTATAKI